MSHRTLPLLLVALAGCPWVGAGDLADKIDEDGDGSSGVRWGGDDCDDGDPAVHPDAVDVPGNTVDEDCDGLLQCFGDQDGDGFGVPSPSVPRTGESCVGPGPGSATDDDCDDQDPLVHPGADEVAGGLVDEDCDGTLDCWLDGDGDGFAVDGADGVDGDDADCDDPGEAALAGDCDDADALRAPDLAEVPGDLVDEDCDGTVDCWLDADEDGSGNDQGTIAASADLDCDEPDEAIDALDCDDGEPSIGPNVAEAAGNLVDEDCDGTVDCWTDGDDDTFGSDVPLPGDDLDCDDAGESTLSTDCDDGDEDVSPLDPEVIGNLVDEDCDGAAECPPGDTDGDSVCDTDDECAGEDDTLDADGDGAADACDDAPFDADDDDDSLLDGREDADGDGDVDPGETDPADPDSNGDGACDGPRADNDGNGLAAPVGCTSVWFIRPGATLPIDGFAWDSAFAHPGDAIDAMSAGEQAWVAAGTYGARGAATDPILELEPDEALYGGFVGDERSLADRPDPLLDTILDGDTNASGGADAGDALHVVVASSDSLLDGFVVSGGYADQGPGPDEGGGGLLVGPGVVDVTVAHTRFVGAGATGPGGAVHVGPGGELALVDVAVEGATARDGACVFAGGALTWTGGSATGCVATEKGGGLFVGDVTRLDDVLLTGDDADEGGGVFVAMTGELTMVTSDVVGNTATVAAGILAGQASGLTIVSSTIAGHTGDGLTVDSVPGVVLHGVTIADNTGVGVAALGTAAITIQNSILYGNGTEISGTPTVSTTCVQGGFAGAVTVTTDPFFRAALPDGRDAWFLTSSGVCLNAGDDTLADAAYGAVGLDWRTMSTRTPYAADAPPVDLGRHYPAP